MDLLLVIVIIDSHWSWLWQQEIVLLCVKRQTKIHSVQMNRYWLQIKRQEGSWMLVSWCWGWLRACVCPVYSCYPCCGDLNLFIQSVWEKQKKKVFECYIWGWKLSQLGSRFGKLAMVWVGLHNLRDVLWGDGNTNVCVCVSKRKSATAALSASQRTLVTIWVCVWWSEAEKWKRQMDVLVQSCVKAGGWDRSGTVPADLHLSFTLPLFSFLLSLSVTFLLFSQWE